MSRISWNFHCRDYRRAASPSLETQRGADLSISLERLEAIRERFAERSGYSLCRIGLSATAAPLDLLAALSRRNRPTLSNRASADRKEIDRRSFLADSARSLSVSRIHRCAAVCRARRSDSDDQQSVLVFTECSFAAEQIGLRLRELLPELSDQIETHHASLDRSVRLEVEDRLKNGELRAVVCSTSLELGIDIGAVDLVVMVATPKGVSARYPTHRSVRHSLNRTSHGVLVATNINDLVEATVTLRRLVREHALDPIRIQEKTGRCSSRNTWSAIAALAPIKIDDAFAIITTRAYPIPRSHSR